MWSEHPHHMLIYAVISAQFPLLNCATIKKNWLLRVDALLHYRVWFANVVVYYGSYIKCIFPSQTNHTRTCVRTNCCNCTLSKADEVCVCVCVLIQRLAIN